MGSVTATPRVFFISGDPEQNVYNFDKKNFFHENNSFLPLLLFCCMNDPKLVKTSIFEQNDFKL